MAIVRGKPLGVETAGSLSAEEFVNAELTNFDHLKWRYGGGKHCRFVEHRAALERRLWTMFYLGASHGRT